MPKKKVTEAVEDTAQETIPVEKAPAQMPRRQGSEDLLELNGQYWFKVDIGTQEGEPDTEEEPV